MHNSAEIRYRWQREGAGACGAQNPRKCTRARPKEGRLSPGPVPALVLRLLPPRPWLENEERKRWLNNEGFQCSLKSWARPPKAAAHGKAGGGRFVVKGTQLGHLRGEGGRPGPRVWIWHENVREAQKQGLSKILSAGIGEGNRKGDMQGGKRYGPEN